MNHPIRIGIMGWSVYRLSGTGSVIRTLLQGLKDNSKINFTVALPLSGEFPFSNLTLNSVVVGDNRDNIDTWMRAAQQVLISQTDVIFYPDSNALSSNACLSSTTTPKMIVTLLHDVLPLTLPEYYIHPLKYWREKNKFSNIARHADKIITISKHSQKMIVDKLKIPKEKIHLIYNGIDPYFHNDHIPENPDRRGILYVGDLRRRKNVMALIKAYRLLNQSIRNQHPLILTAEGKQKQNIVKALKNLSTPPIFKPNLNQRHLKEIYLQAKLFVFPSLQEGFGLPVIEAQHNGLPVICGSHTALKEIIGGFDSPTAYKVDVRRPRAIANAIVDLLSQSNLYRNYQLKGFANSCRFTATQMVSSYQNFFETVAKEIKVNRS